MSAEFASLSDFTGLDTAFLSGRLGVSEFEVNRWRAPHANPPRAVLSLLESVLYWQHQKLELLRRVAQNGQRVHLLRFYQELDFIAMYGDSFPYPAYEQLIATAFSDLRARQLSVVLHYFDADSYHRWRGRLSDTPQLRALWVARLNDPSADLARADDILQEVFGDFSSFEM